MQFSILKCTRHKYFIFQRSSKICLVVWHTTLFFFGKICHDSCRVAHDIFFILKKNVMKLVVWHMTIFFCPIFVVCILVETLKNRSNFRSMLETLKRHIVCHEQGCAEYIEGFSTPGFYER